jgi:hypothetical protein
MVRETVFVNLWEGRRCDEQSSEETVDGVADLFDLAEALRIEARTGKLKPEIEDWPFKKHQ